MMQTDMIHSDWQRNPGMAMRSARYACIEHESLGAYIDICPRANADGLFDVDSDAYAIAKLYTRHDDLEGVQFREQIEIPTEDDAEIVVRELIDMCYSEYPQDVDVYTKDRLNG